MGYVFFARNDPMLQRRYEGILPGLDATATTSLGLLLGFLQKLQSSCILVLFPILIILSCSMFPVWSNSRILCPHGSQGPRPLPSSSTFLWQ